MDYLSKRKYLNFNYQFHYLLIYIIILFYNSESKNRRLPDNIKSQIKITFANKGKNRYISNYCFLYCSVKPSSISTYWKNDCSIYTSNNCEIKDDGKTITLNYDKKADTCEQMFRGLNNIIEIDLSNFDSSNVKSMAYMFQNCYQLKKIKFGNMDTSNVENMEYLFDGCNKLESLDISNFDTSSVKKMRYMFSRLHSLKSLKLSENFKTSGVTNMEYMFYQIKILISNIL